MQPDLGLEQVAPELIGTGAQAVVNDAKRLGLTWTMTLATVTSASPIEAIVDGDSVAIGMVSMIGSLSVGRRIYVIQVPPSGNFVVGSTQGPFFRRHTLPDPSVQQTGLVHFTGIPGNLRKLRIDFHARTNYGGFQAEVLTLRVNGHAGADYYYQGYQSSGAAIGASGASAQTQYFVGVIDSGSGAFSPGYVEFPDWDLAAGGIDLGIHSMMGALNSPRWQNTIVGNLGVAAGTSAPPYTSVTFISEHGADFSNGSDFQLSGEYA